VWYLHGRGGAFPFLIGTVRTVIDLETLEQVAEVFPFLIGTVRTCFDFLSFMKFVKFPFLIGTVRTGVRYTPKLITARFPFLIGTVRTKGTGRGTCEERSFHSS